MPRTTTTKSAKSAKSTETADVTAVAEPTAEPTAAPAPVAALPEKPVVASGRYADPETLKAIANGLDRAKAKGWTRPALSALTELNGSAVWRAQNHKTQVGEVDLWLYTIKQIDEGKVQMPERAVARTGPRVTRDSIVRQNERAATILDMALAAKGNDVTALIQQALDTLRGKVDDTETETDK